MHTPTNSASHPLPPSRIGSLRTRPTEDVVYQIVTVAAILIVLGTTLWVF
jgi:hypothetical protein